MAGISDKAAGSLTNRYKLTGKELQSGEFSDGSGLEIYDFGFRNHDPQIGRWNQIDPLADLFSGISPYNDREDNPSNKYDPDGLSSSEFGPQAITDWVHLPNNKVIFDPNVHNDKDAARLHGKGSTDIGKEVDLYDPSTDTQVHGNPDGTTSPIPMAGIVVNGKSKSNWYGMGNKINWGFGATASMIEGGSGISRIGTNFTLYTATQTGRVFLGNQYVKTFEISKIGGLVGKVSFFAGVALDANGVYTYYKNGADDPNAVHPAKASLNTVIGAYGVWVDPPVAVIYFGVDAFYPGGVEGFVKDQGENLSKLNQTCNCDASMGFY